MNPDHGTVDLPSETTEQALARVEAECGWSDASRFVELAPAVPAVPAPAGDRREG